MKACPPVLILGCGRSGTSIFGELFDGMAGYTYYSEPDFSDMLASFGNDVAVKVPTEADDYPADRGLSFPLATLLARAPTTKIFWIVRHPLDAICSLRIGIGKNWSHHPRPPDWQDWLEKPLIERCAHHWTYVNSLGFDAVESRATLVRFEDMIQSPYAFACRVLAEVGLLEDEHQVSLRAWSDRVQDTNNEKFIEAQTSRNHSRPDHFTRVERWRENLSSQEAAKLSELVEQTNHRFGYDLSV